MTPDRPTHSRLVHGFALRAFALVMMCASGWMHAQTITLSVTDGTDVENNFNGLWSLLFYVPDQDVYLNSFTYLGSDGVTGRADGVLYMDTYASAWEVPSEDPAEGFSNSGGVVVDGVWNFAPGAVVLSAGQSYSFAIANSNPLSGVGINGSGSGYGIGGEWNNAGAMWWGFSIPRDWDSGSAYFNFRLEVTPIPEPATAALTLGVAALGVLWWRRRRALFKAGQG